MDIKIGQLWQSESDPEIIVKIMVVLHLPESIIVIAKDRDTGRYYCEPETDWRTNWEMLPEKWEPKNPPPRDNRSHYMKCEAFVSGVACYGAADKRFCNPYAVEPSSPVWLCDNHILHYFATAEQAKAHLYRP